VPDNAILYIQVAESPLCHDWNWLNLSKYNIKVPEAYVNLAGDAIWDVQLSEFEDFKPVTDPIEAFKFSFSGKEPLVFENQSILQAVAKKNVSKAHGIFMWWVCRMDFEGEILLSCAPKWAHHTPKDMQVE
jgi:type III protein arginine methyltransferase